MRKVLLLCGVFLCLSLTAAAQDATAEFDAASPAGEPAAPSSLTPADREPWQIGIGFQYQHFKALGQDFHTLGYNAQITRYLNNWFGVEGTSDFGFGHTGTTPNLSAKSFFLGGGPHIAWDNHSRFEPFVHVLVGWDHLRFTQTSGILGSNSSIGFMGGGGADYKIGARAYWRIEGDYFGTHFRSTTQSNYSIGTGLVFNF